MSDEATIAVKGITKLDYSLKQYLTFTEAMCKKAEELNKLGMVNKNDPVFINWLCVSVAP